MNILNKTILLTFICMLPLQASNLQKIKLSKEDEQALQLLGAMQEVINLNKQAEQQLPTPQITDQINQYKDYFSQYLMQYLMFGQIYEQRSGLLGGYRYVYHISSQYDPFQAIMPNEYPLLIEVLQAAISHSDWGSTINIELSVNKNGLMNQKSLTLQEILDAIKQVAPPASSYISTFLTSAAAIAAISVGAYYAGLFNSKEVAESQIISDAITAMTSTPSENSEQNRDIIATSAVQIESPEEQEEWEKINSAAEILYLTNLGPIGAFEAKKLRRYERLRQAQARAIQNGVDWIKENPGKTGMGLVGAALTARYGRTGLNKFKGAIKNPLGMENISQGVGTGVKNFEQTIPVATEKTTENISKFASDVTYQPVPLENSLVILQEPTNSLAVIKPATRKPKPDLASSQPTIPQNSVSKEQIIQTAGDLGAPGPYGEEFIVGGGITPHS